MIAACSGGAKKGEVAVGAGAIATSGPAADAPPVVKPPRAPFKPKKLACKSLLDPVRAEKLLGFAVDLVQRANKRDGETSLVCTHRSALPTQALSFLVSCGKKTAPREDFERLFALHEKLAGAEVLPEKRGVSTPTSYLALHPYRPCFLQVACRAPLRQPGGASRLAAEIAAALP